MVKVLAASDLHSFLPNIPECDVLILGGDICPDGRPSLQSNWLETIFRKWLDAIPAKEIIGVAGNHDKIFEEASELVPKNLRWHYLQDSSVELFGLKFYGTPWQLPFWGAFNADEESLKEIYKGVPLDTDVFISHGPPYAIGDDVNGRLEGSHALRECLFKIKPKLAVFGHIHPAFGQWKIDEVTFANVSLLNDALEVVHLPVEFNL